MFIRGAVSPSSSNPANSFVDGFKRKYGDENTPVFLRGTLSDAFRESARQAKPLCIYLHSNAATEANIYCSEVLSSESVRGFLNEHFVLWGWDMSKPYTQRMLRHEPGAASVLSALPSQYPALSVFMKTPEGPTLISSLLGYHDQAAMFDFLIDAVQKSTPFVDELHDRRRAHQQAKELVTEQDSEYQRSLIADREKVCA